MKLNEVIDIPYGESTSLMEFAPPTTNTNGITSTIYKKGNDRLMLIKTAQKSRIVPLKKGGGRGSGAMTEFKTPLDEYEYITSLQEDGYKVEKNPKIGRKILGFGAAAGVFAGIFKIFHVAEGEYKLDAGEGFIKSTIGAIRNTASGIFGKKTMSRDDISNQMEPEFESVFVDFSNQEKASIIDQAISQSTNWAGSIDMVELNKNVADMVTASRNEKLLDMSKEAMFTLDYTTPDWATWVGGMFSKIPSPDELGRMAIDAIF